MQALCYSMSTGAQYRPSRPCKDVVMKPVRLATAAPAHANASSPIGDSRICEIGLTIGLTLALALKMTLILTLTRAQIRPYLMADGGNVEFVEIDGPVVYLRLQGACGSCPSSLTTMTMGIKRRLMEKIPVRLLWLCHYPKLTLIRTLTQTFILTPPLIQATAHGEDPAPLPTEGKAAAWLTRTGMKLSGQRHSVTAGCILTTLLSTAQVSLVRMRAPSCAPRLCPATAPLSLGRLNTETHESLQVDL